MTSGLQRMLCRSLLLEKCPLFEKYLPFEGCPLFEKYLPFEGCPLFEMLFPLGRAGIEET